MNTRRFRLHLVAILMLSITTAVMFIWAGRGAQAQAEQLTPPSAQILKQVLVRTGFGADRLAAAGLSTSATSTLVSNVADYLSEHPNSLFSADSAVQTAQQSLATLRRQIQSGSASPEQIQAQSAAESALAQATTDRQNAVNGIIEAAVDGMNSSPAELLGKMRSNAPWDLPLQYLAVDRTEAHWVHLRDALTAQRSAAAHDDDLDSTIASYLAEVSGDSVVAAVSANLAANLASVTSSWDQSISDVGSEN